jgi:hypothetical protein
VLSSGDGGAIGNAGWLMDDAGPDSNELRPAALPLGKVAAAWIDFGTETIARESGSPGFNTLAMTPTLDINTRAPAAKNKARGGGRVDELDGATLGGLSEGASSGTGSAGSVAACSSPRLGIRRSWSDFVTSSREPIGNFTLCRSTSLATRAESSG